MKIDSRAGAASMRRYSASICTSQSPISATSSRRPRARRAPRAGGFRARPSSRARRRGGCGDICRAERRDRAPVCGEFAREGGGLCLRCMFGEKAALHQRGDGAGEHARLVAEMRARARRNRRAARAASAKASNSAAASSSTASAQLRNRVDEKRRGRAELKDMGEGGAAQQHAAQAGAASRRGACG